MENKEAVRKIIIYLESQPTDVVNRLCANLMVDINRWYHFYELDEVEKLSLIKRSRHNSNELNKFLKDEDNNTLLILENIK